MVPTDKPDVAFHIIDAFLNNRDISLREDDFDAEGAEWKVSQTCSKSAVRSNFDVFNASSSLSSQATVK